MYNLFVYNPKKHCLSFYKNALVKLKIYFIFSISKQITKMKCELLLVVIFSVIYANCVKDLDDWSKNYT